MHRHAIRIFINRQGNILEDQIDDDDDNHEAMEEDTNDTYYENDEEQSTDQLGKESGSSGSNESDENEPMKDNQVDIDHLRAYSMILPKILKQKMMRQSTESPLKTSI